MTLVIKLPCRAERYSSAHAHDGSVGKHRLFSKALKKIGTKKSKTKKTVSSN